jgi:hypothetical protein
MNAERELAESRRLGRIVASFEQREAYNSDAETAAKTLRLECARPGTCAVSHVPGHCVTGDRP